jgi:hypothetical protein
VRYVAEITHVRQAPVHRRFSYTSATSLVDLDRLPQLPRGLRWLSRYDSRDHLGDPRSSLRANLERFLAGHRIDLDGGRILMLANPRGLGHAFNPISIFWAYDGDDALTAVVAEVHNTYGDRHAYLLRPDGSDRLEARLDKRMYVSPFNPVDGSYRISVSPPADRISLSVRLDRPGQPPFVATLTASRRGSTSPVRNAIVAATTSLRVTTLIRWQGMRLFLRGLRVEPRPVHARQEGVG